MTRLAAALLAAGIGLAAAPARGPEDPLYLESKWTGKLTQKGKIEGRETPYTLEAELAVVKRDGAKFEGKLREWNDGGIKLTYLVKGNVVKAKDGKSFKVEFKSYDSKDAASQTFINIPYTGTLDGKTISGTWKHPKNDNGITIEGDFKLEKK
jgi:hypothetical protein